MITILAIDEIRRVTRSGKSIAQLEKEIHRLENILKPVMQFPIEWKLSKAESRILAAIYAGDDRYVSRPRILYALHGDAPPRNAEMTLKTQLCHLRSKMRIQRVRLLSRYGVGYRLDAWSREFVRKAIEQKGS